MSATSKAQNTIFGHLATMPDDLKAALRIQAREQVQAALEFLWSLQDTESPFDDCVAAVVRNIKRDWPL